jgi:hypothetical protein
LIHLFRRALRLGERVARLSGDSRWSPADGLVAAVVLAWGPVLVALVADLGPDHGQVPAGSRRSTFGAALLARSRDLGASIQGSVPFPVELRPDRRH